MSIEQKVTYLKSITIKNHQLQKKQYYLVLVINKRVHVGSVVIVEVQGVRMLGDWTDLQILIRTGDEMIIQLWDYDSFQQANKIQVSCEQILSHNSLTFQDKLFDIEISSLSSSVNQIQIQSKQQKDQILTNRKQFIFPLIKTLDNFSTSNSRQKNTFSVNSYKSQSSQLYQCQSQSVESILWSETSLEKIMEFSSQSSKVKRKQEKIQSLQIVKSKENQKFKLSDRLNFDDYEAQPKNRNSISRMIKDQKILLSSLTTKEKHEKKSSKQANSTASSSLVKKTLKSTIQKLTQNPFKIQQKQMQVQNSKYSKEISKQWLVDYGLVENSSKRGSKRQKSSNKYSSKHKIDKDISVIYDSPELKSFCQKSLSRQQIQNVQNMNSFQLSQSIFQQYGLNLSSSAKISSKPQKRQSVVSKSNEQKKQNNIHESSNKGQKISAFNVEYKFEDYGQRQICKNSKRVK